MKRRREGPESFIKWGGVISFGGGGGGDRIWAWDEKVLCSKSEEFKRFVIVGSILSDWERHWGRFWEIGIGRGDESYSRSYSSLCLEGEVVSDEEGDEEGDEKGEGEGEGEEWDEDDEQGEEGEDEEEEEWDKETDEQVEPGVEGVDGNFL